MAAKLYHQTLNLFRTRHVTNHSLKIRTLLITSGILQNPSLARNILKLAADLGDLSLTLLLFRSIHILDTFCINTVVKAYALGNNNSPLQALTFYFHMLRNGFSPNSYTYPALISSCGKTGSLGLGEKTHCLVVKNGVDFVLPVGNSLIHMYSCCGYIGFAQKLFDAMPVRDLVSWNTIVGGYVKVDELGIAHKVFDMMPNRNNVSYNVLIDGYLKCGNPGVCLKLFREMVNKGLRRSETTVVSVVTACGRSARLREGRSLHCFVIKGLWDSNLIVDTALVDMYSRCQMLNAARLVFDKMLVRNLVCWNVMILGHCLFGNPQDGLELYESMVDNGHLFCDNEMKLDGEIGLRPDEITFIGVLCACARLGFLTEGRYYFKEMVDSYRVKPNFAHYWCMANLFASTGLIQDALEVLRKVPVDKDEYPEYFIWARLLGLCRFEGNAVLGEKVAKFLIELEPGNALCYRLLLNVYAVAGRWDDVAEIKQMMKKTGLKSKSGCSLLDLKEIVHDFKLGDNLHQYLQEISTMISESAKS